MIISLRVVIFLFCFHILMNRVALDLVAHLNVPSRYKSTNTHTRTQTYLLKYSCNKDSSSALPCIILCMKVRTVIVAVNPIVDLMHDACAQNTIIIVYFIAFMPFNFSTQCALLREHFFPSAPPLHLLLW